MSLLLIYLLFLLCSCAFSSGNRIYKLRKCSGSSCPYAAAWFADVNTYITSQWYLHSTKMEQASFNIFDRANSVFQFDDTDVYYVHHMSMYEHFVHKNTNLTYAKQQSYTLSKAAFYGECGNLIGINKYKGGNSSFSLIPFFGGLPPNVTADFQVKSLGQGNSLVSSIL